MKRRLDHRGKRVSYEWADKRRENRKRDLLWDWVQYIELEGCEYGFVPKKWSQVEWELDRATDGLLKRAMKDE